MSFAAVVGLLATACGAMAQAPPDSARLRLELERQQLDDKHKREQALQSDVEAMREERERLNARLLETARLVQASEAQMSTIEARLTELETQEKLVRGSLEAQRGSIAKLLGAMQRMGRNPPPVMITRREDALTMVRSAMLLAAAFPELRDKALALADQLNDLTRVVTSIRTEGDRLRVETGRLADARLKLAGVMESKRVSLAERQAELDQVRKAATEIAKSVSDLSELIAKLDKEVENNTGLGAYQRQVAIEQKRVATAPVLKPTLPPLEPTAGPAPPPVPNAAGAAKGEPPAEVATATQPAARKRVVARPSVELAPNADRVAMAAPGRIKPAIAFHLAKGQLPLPARGRRVINFGERMQNGNQSKGIVIETRAGAQVTAPADGWIVFAGEFRSYGQLLIINTGDGYHLLLAGLSQIDVQTGQFVLAGEPVGTMAAASKTVPATTAANAPVLFVEFRKEGRSIDPDPWWADSSRKVQG